MGGAFDPVHLGHINLAGEMLLKRDLAGVLLVPTFNHPTKRPQTFASYDDRLEMLRLSITGEEHLTICEVEKEQNLPGYTLDTVRALKIRYPQAAFFFIIGSDNISQIEHWHHPEEILAEVPILAGCRPGVASPAVNPIWAQRIQLVDTAPFEASSSAVRDMVNRGASADELAQFVGPAVAAYIINRKLYQS